MTERRNESGTALIIALLVMVIMTLLGIPFLMMGETENRIAENERLALQAQYAAEAGARMVRSWFDKPLSPLNAIAPDLAAVDRSQRLIDDDNDPTTAPVAAIGSPALPYYKQDDNTIFQKPFRGSLVDTLLGSEGGPDMRIAREDSVAAEGFLDALSQKLFQGYVNAGGTSARITRIDVYAPPMTQRAGSWVRLGVGTVKVEAGIYLPLPGGGARTLAKRSVRFVFNEIPYQNEKLGALHTCGDLEYPQSILPRWGTMTAEGDVILSHYQRLPVGIPRNPSPSLVEDSIWPPDSDPIKFYQYYNHAAVEGEWVEAPWFRLIVGGLVDEAPNVNTHPWPFGWTLGTLSSGDFTYHLDPTADGYSSDPGDAKIECGIGVDCDGTYSNVVQDVDIGCPEFSYEVWKSIALRGGPNIHYFAWDAGESAFKENGSGVARSFREWTHDGEGLFFFDTVDGLPPDGSNLTPNIVVDGGSWGVKGVVYLNAAEFGTNMASGNYIDYFPPGEPFLDQPVSGTPGDPGNGVFDAGEPFVNLQYPTDLTSDIKIDSTDAWNESGGPAVVRNARGPAVNARANVYGIFYNSGMISSTGEGYYYGSLISGSGIENLSINSDGPRSYWDASMRGDDWPPPAWGLPNIVVTRWETGT